MNMNRLQAMGLLALSAVSLASAVSAAPTARQSRAATSYSLENPEVRRGYEAVLAAIALVPSKGPRAQYQAQIAYALDQTQLDCPTTLASLDVASRQAGLAPAVYGALRDVTEAAERCDAHGIAAIEGGPAGLLLGYGPGVGFGGGSSNYGGQ
jgi:hypothetical protein